MEGIHTSRRRERMCSKVFDFIELLLNVTREIAKCYRFSTGFEADFKAIPKQKERLKRKVLGLETVLKGLFQRQIQVMHGHRKT